MNVEALDIIALQLDANAKLGTPQHAESVRLLEAAKQEWRDQLKGAKCPHCGKRPNETATEPPL